MRKFVIVSLICLLLSGCGYSTVEEAQNAQELKHTTHNRSSSKIDELLQVGQTLKLEKVSLSDKYNLMYENEKGELTWVVLDRREAINYSIKKSDQPYSYIVREKNIVEENGVQSYSIVSSYYILYLKTDTLEGSSYKESCGKHCEKEVYVEMLD